MAGQKGGDYRAIDVEFKWADSDTVYDEMEDFYCDGDAAPLGRLNFIYQNYVPGVTVLEPETTAPETEAPTEPATEPTTEAPVAETTAEAETDPVAATGCASTVGIAAIALVALMGTALLRKRED